MVQKHCLAKHSRRYVVLPWSSLMLFVKFGLRFWFAVCMSDEYNYMCLSAMLKAKLMEAVSEITIDSMELLNENPDKEGMKVCEAMGKVRCK